MKEPEFSKTADNKYWMDTNVISDHPVKMTIIDPYPYISKLVEIFESMETFREDNRGALKHLARATVTSLMTAVIGRARAWEHGHDVDFELHQMNIRNVVGIDMGAVTRDDFRKEIELKENEHLDRMLNIVVKDIIELMQTHMNKNRYTVHRLSHSKDARTINLEEYADWRVIQFTKDQMSKIDARHEDI